MEILVLYLGWVRSLHEERTIRQVERRFSTRDKVLRLRDQSKIVEFEIHLS